MNLSIKIETFDLTEAATFLRMNSEILRRKAFSGEIPGTKSGKGWVFLNIDLVAYLRSKYPPNKQDLQSAEGKEKEVQWDSKKEVVSGTSTLSSQTDEEYEKALGLKTKKRRKNSTTG